MVTNKDLFEFAFAIDNIVAVGDFEEFFNKHRKLVELYDLLRQYGLVPEYEYAYHKDGDVIPCIVFYPFIEDDLENPGLPGIMITSENGMLHLQATDTVYSIDEAIELNISDADDLFDPTEYYDNGYIQEVFATDSVSDMGLYLSCLSNIEFVSGGLLVPITKERVATYWTKLLDNGKISYDRVTIHRVELGTYEDGEPEYAFTINACIDESEENILIDRLAAVKAIISEISENYIADKHKAG